VREKHKMSHSGGVHEIVAKNSTGHPRGKERVEE